MPVKMQKFLMLLILPFAFAYMAFLIETNNAFGDLPTSVAIANCLLIGALVVMGYDIVWVAKKIMGGLSASPTFSDGGSRINSKFKGEGVFFGVDSRGRDVGRNMNSDGHILVVGGPGTGKSSCIAIPVLKDTWTSNFLAIDIKGELAKKKRA